MKECIKCFIEKDISLFVKDRNVCKDCMRIYKTNNRLGNIEYIKIKSREYYLNNKQEICEDRKIHYSLNRDSKIEYQKNYYLDNKDKIIEYKKEHTAKNRDKIREYKNNYQNDRRKNDPIFKLKYVVSRTIRRSLKCKGLSKSQKSIEILGCDIEFFKSYLESMFIDDMNWDNYGSCWDIDHIIPLSTAENEDDVIKLNHYTNLQPLDSYINRNVKKDRLDYLQLFFIF